MSQQQQQQQQHHQQPQQQQQQQQRGEDTNFIRQTLISHSNTNNTLNKQRSNGKGKFLTRSHAMRECTSPPRTPTPRLINEQTKNDPVNNSKRSSQPITVNTSSNNTIQGAHQSTTSNNLFATNGNMNVSQLDLEFPKLTPPKSKSPRNHNNNSNSSSSSSSNNNNNANNNNNNNNNNSLNNNISNCSSNPNENTVNSGNSTASTNTSNASNMKTSQSNSETVAIGSNVTNSSNTANRDGEKSTSNCSNNSNVEFSVQSAPLAAASSTAPATASSASRVHVGYSQSNKLNTNIVSKTNAESAGGGSATSNGASTPTQPSTNQSNAIAGDSASSKSTADGQKSNSTPVVGCTILLNDVEKKSDQLLQGNQKNSSDDNYTDKDNANADDTVEFVYKKNRNSSAAKGGGGGGGGKQRSKHNNQTNNNNNSSLDAPHHGASNGNQCDYLSPDSSFDHFTDQSGVDLLQFFKITLNKNAKDRYMLLRIEKELAALAQDQSRDVIKFPTMSSYNRMLIHRVAAWFGMEHNVDSSVQCVIVNTAKTTRLPEIRFKTLLTDTFSDETPSRKSILKRDAHSFEEYRQGLLGCPDRGNMLDRKAKSFEEREQEYEKAKRRIFKDMNSESIEQFWHNWSNSTNSDNAKYGGDRGDRNNKSRDNRLLRVQSSSTESRYDGRPSVEKSHSFGGYGPQSSSRLARGDSVNSTKSAVLSKQDSSGSQQGWRLSPSSSGYKTQSQSLRSDSVTPSPSYGSVSGDHTPEPIPSMSTGGIVWAVTDMASVPKGSVLIDPQTLKPLVNQDGTIYHFDPSNLPPCSKLQIPNVSPAATPSPTLLSDTSNASNRKRNKSANSSEDVTDVQRTSINCDTENSSAGAIHDENGSGNPEIEVSSEVEITIPEPTKTISMNSLLSPINQVYQDTHDNNLNRNSDDNCREAVVHANVKNQSTSPHIPNELDVTYMNAGEPAVVAVTVDENSSQVTGESKDGNIDSGATSNNQPANELKTQTTVNQPTFADKKDEIKILPAVVPVLAAPPPNVYPPLEAGVQLFTGTQPTPSSFPTYQQGLDGSIYAVPQPMIYGYPAVENEYPGGIFVYDQSGQAQQPIAANGQQTAAANAVYPSTALTAAFSSAAFSTAAVVPVHRDMLPPTAKDQMCGYTVKMYTDPNATAPAPYGTAHNLYQGQILYTPDQYPAAQANGQVPQYINYPVGYTYPYNGPAAYPAYWGQAMTYYVPQTVSAPATSVAPTHPAASSSSDQKKAMKSTEYHSANAAVTFNRAQHFSDDVDRSSSGDSSANKSHVTATHQSQHSSTVAASVKTPLYTPSPSSDTKTITNSGNVAQTNVFQYPPAMTSSPTTSSPLVNNNSTTTNTANNNTPAVTTPIQSISNSDSDKNATESDNAKSGQTDGALYRPRTNRSSAPQHHQSQQQQQPESDWSATTTPSHGSDNSKLVSHISTGHSSHSASSVPSSHLIHNTKNHQPLYSAPNESTKTNSDETYHEPKEYSNHSSGNYERKKNQQNVNRKPGVYRPNIGINSHNALSANSHQQTVQSSTANTSIRKGPLIHQTIAESSGHNHIYTSGAGHHHSENTSSSYNRGNSSQINSSSSTHAEHSEKRPTHHNKPLIATLPTMNNVSHGSNHMDRVRGTRPKPLDLRRNINSSNRNTPSSNSTESNNSPNSIVSSEQQQQSQNHQSQVQQQQQQPLYISRGNHQPVHSSHPVVRMYHGDLVTNANDCSSITSPSSTLCGEPFAYNPHPGMYIKLGGQTYITHSMAFPNKAQQNDIRQSLPPITGIYPTMNMMLTGYPAAPRPVGPRPSHVNPNYKNNRTPR